MIPDRGETSGIPGLPWGSSQKEKNNFEIIIKLSLGQFPQGKKMKTTADNLTEITIISEVKMYHLLRRDWTLT